MADPVRLYGGTIADFADSMAEEIEKAFNQVRGENGLPALSGTTVDVRDRRMLFIAIARGVINHLDKKHAAFEVAVPEPLDDAFPVHIDVRRPPSQP